MDQEALPDRATDRMIGSRRDSIEGLSWGFARLAIDDHSRAGYADEPKGSAVVFPYGCCGALRRPGRKGKSENGSAFRAFLFAWSC